MNYQLIIDDIIGSWGYSKQYVKNVLISCKNKPCAVKISSLGGSLDHGLDIRQQFIDHGDVTAYLSGFIASAATVCSLGAKKICMGKYSMYLVHKCSNYLDVWGTYNADEIQTLIDQLTANKKENDKIDVVLANMYADRCQKNVGDLLNILKEGKWLTAQEALDYGFIDEILEEDTKINFTLAMQDKFNRIGLPCAGIDQELNTNPSILTTLLDSIKDIKTLFSNSHNNNNSDNGENNKIDMVDKFNTVAKLLNIQQFTATKDNSITLSADQLQAINDRLDALENDVTTRDNTIVERDSTINDLNVQITNLNDSPADDTIDIKGEDKDKSDNSAFGKSKDLFNNVKNLL